MSKIEAGRLSASDLEHAPRPPAAAPRILRRLAFRRLFIGLREPLALLLQHVLKTYTSWRLCCSSCLAARRLRRLVVGGRGLRLSRLARRRRVFARPFHPDRARRPRRGYVLGSLPSHALCCWRWTIHEWIVRVIRRSVFRTRPVWHLVIGIRIHFQSVVERASLLDALLVFDHSHTGGP